MRYRQLTPVTSSFTTANVTDISQQYIFIHKLQESGEYQVSVSCFTAACLGPFSDTVEFTVADPMLQTAPSNVTVLSVNSTCIRVSFQPPHFTEWRSDVYYVVTASRPVDGSRVRRDGEMTVGTVGRDGDHTATVRGRLTTDDIHSDYVSGLNKFSIYHITVRLETDTAAGPHSPTVVVHTLDDGMFCLHCHTALGVDTAAHFKKPTFLKINALLISNCHHCSQFLLYFSFFTELMLFVSKSSIFMLE